MKYIRININKVQLLTITIVVIVLLFGGSSVYKNNNVYGHNFAGDESASFLALMDQMQTEMNLLNTNLIADNQSLAKDHLNQINQLYTKNIKKEIGERNERITNDISSVINLTKIYIEEQGRGEEQNQNIPTSIEHFKDVLSEGISVRIDPDAMTNATIHALHFANLINSIDVSYADALGTKPMNMSAMNMGNDSSISHGNNNNTMSDMQMDHRYSSSNMKSMGKDTSNNSNANETNTVVTNIASFQTAKELTNNAIELFNSTIKQNISSNATTDNGNVIEYSLKQLKNMIESKEPYYKIMGIIHGVIQTNTQDIFKLPLKTSQ
jgi:hypothetical protein